MGGHDHGHPARQGQVTGGEAAPPADPTSLEAHHRAAADLLRGDREAFALLAEGAVGSRRAASEATPALPPETWENFGWLPDGPDGFVRHVDLSLTASGVTAGSSLLQELDGIGIITIDRGGAGPQYLYDTLQAVATTFPDDAALTLWVGDDRDAFVSPAALAVHGAAIPADQLARRPASPAAAAFLARFGVHRRAAWNYARALLGYTGQRGLLVMEDDVRWARGGVEKLDWWLAGRTLPVISLYNRVDPPYEGAVPVPLTQLVRPQLGRAPAAFSCTQAMVYAAPYAPVLGRYIMLRMHARPYDILIGQCLRALRTVLGMCYPSLVQHEGQVTTGLGDFHRSACFEARV